MASDIELRTLKEEAEEALVEAEWLLEELRDFDMGRELNADTLQWLIPQVKRGMRRTGGKFHALKKDKDAVGAIGALMQAVDSTRSMLRFFEEEDRRLQEGVAIRREIE